MDEARWRMLHSGRSSEVAHSSRVTRSLVARTSDYSSRLLPVAGEVGIVVCFTLEGIHIIKSKKRSLLV
jgi:hypothetical protein